MADVSAAFIAQYEAEVHMAYQQGGSMLRNTVRLKTGVVGSSTTFQKIGKGSATAKGRHQDVTPMNVDHTKATATIENVYGPDYVDKLDEYKINHDERKALIISGAGAVGRAVDDKIIAAADTTVLPGNTVGDGTTLMTLDIASEGFTLLNEHDVPLDRQRYAVVGPRQWNQLLKLDQFAKSDFVGTDYIWMRGYEAKLWMGTIWMMHTGLVKPTGTSTRCLMYHRTALGLAENGSGITSEINYIPAKVAYLCTSFVGAGACAIDADGIVVMHCKDK